MEQPKKIAGRPVGMAGPVKQLISKAMELSPTVRDLALLEGTQLQTARARYYLRAHRKRQPEPNGERA